MPEDNPLIRVPTQPTRLTLFGVLAIAGLCSGIFLGIIFGPRYFGSPGAIIGALVGGFVGIVIGKLPSFFMEEHMFRELQKCTNDELKSKLEQQPWTFYQTLALLNLQLRGEDVQSYLPRVLTLLESEDSKLRWFGRDALRLVFTPLAKQLDDLQYDPQRSHEDCRVLVTKLRGKIS